MIEMHKFLKPAKSKRFEIKYKEASASDVKAVKFRDLVQGGHEYEGFKEGTYVQLYDSQSPQPEGWGLYSDEQEQLVD